MESAENQKNQNPKPDGERWLELIGLGHLKGHKTGFEIDGQPVLAEQFDKLCGDYARPIFVGLERMDRDDPDYDKCVEVVRRKFKQYFESA